MSVRLAAPCRLHFGLFHVPTDALSHWPDGTPIPKFGGLGLMVARPNVTVTFVPADAWSASGNLAERALAFAKRFPEAPPFHLEANGPDEHVGLGVGTALGMCVAYHLCSLLPGSNTFSDRERLQLAASRVGRGRRSGIGIHGFQSGGFLVDDGKLSDVDLPTIRERILFPEDWRIILARPKLTGTWHGEQERSAFRRTRSPEEILAITRRLLTIANTSILPALAVKDFDAFSSHLAVFNRIAGEPFVQDQGGPYASAETFRIIHVLESMGIVGVGQSSWGPTVFAFARSETEAEEIRRQLFELDPTTLEATVTAADNRGVQILHG